MSGSTTSPGRAGISLLTAAVLLIGVGVAVAAADETPAPAPPTQQIEEWTESFANALLELSIALRDKDLEKIGGYFAPQLLALPFPSVAGELRRERAWIHRHDWPFASEPRELSRRELMQSLAEFLAHFPSIEDARFKVKASVVRPAERRIEGSTALWLVARDPSNYREWVRARGSVSARRDPEGSWKITRFVLESLDSMVSEREIFAEVSRPAGLAAQAPTYLERSDPSFAAYGAAVADVNEDGLQDILVTGAQGNSLYLNQGDGRFRDEAEAAFVKQLPHTGTAPLFLDFDNDGDRDLFVSAIGTQLLFENRLVPDGRLEFWDISTSAGVAHDSIGFSAVAGDLNKDGYPDIYVAAYNRYGEILPDDWSGASNGRANLLFVSQGDGTFKERAAAWGVADHRWSYAAQFADIDLDGDLDLYVANDFGGGNALYLNEGTRFVDVALERGVVDRGYGMGVNFGDYDNDGDLDLHVTRMSSTAGRRILKRLQASELPQKSDLQNMAAGNALYENLGSGRFREISEAAGPFSGGWAWGGGLALVIMC